jgi:hypothetical protein
VGSAPQAFKADGSLADDGRLRELLATLVAEIERDREGRLAIAS